MKKLNVFVSSTCYDLSQLRVDLRDFISNCGHIPVLSEFENFPINPSKKTIDNCISVVKDEADILILIVGNRYGSLIENGSSITNTEFLTAKNKGIPIYIFIDKRILNILPVWNKNKDGNYLDIVDTTKIFEFISNLRNDSKLWTYEFENAQDIISILKIQFSYLFKEALNYRSRFNSFENSIPIEKVSNTALNIILERGEMFEIEFFIQTLIDEIIKMESFKNDLEYAILLESKMAVYDDLELMHWVKHRLDTITNQIGALNRIVNIAFKKFYGELGTPADLKGLFYVSETYARIYRQMIKWTVETYSTAVNEECYGLRDKLAKLTAQALEQIWKFPFEQKVLISELKEKILRGEKNLELRSNLVIEIDKVAQQEYYKEFDMFKERVNRELGTDYYT